MPDPTSASHVTMFTTLRPLLRVLAISTGMYSASDLYIHSHLVAQYEGKYISVNIRMRGNALTLRGI